MNQSSFRTALAAFLTLLLAGCSSGSGGSNGGGNQLNGIEGTGFAKGTVTRFGSLFVNGIGFSTTGATFTIDGRSGTESDVQAGAVAFLTGSIASGGRSGTATSVVIDDAVEGPVESIDLDTRSLLVMGQTVRVDALTVFALGRQPESLVSVQTGDVLEVSGFRDAQDVILATRVERKAAGADFEVTGIVRNADTVAMRFTIGALIVDYGSAQLVDVDGGAPANGALVEAKGATLTGGLLSAMRVAGRSAAIPGSGNDRAAVEGLITRIVSATELEIDGQRVTTGAATRYENGSAADLIAGRRVAVEGGFSASALSADVVRFEVGTDLRVAAPVDSVDAASGRFVVLGITVETDARTLFVDQSDAPVRPFDVASLRAGDYVEVRGGPGSAANRILAARVERDDDDDDDIELRGRAGNLMQPQFSILGVTILTNTDTEFEEGDDDIAADEFFARAAGQLVSVESEVQPVNGVLLAEEAEIDGDDDLDD